MNDFTSHLLNKVNGVDFSRPGALTHRITIFNMRLNPRAGGAHTREPLAKCCVILNDVVRIEHILIWPNRVVFPKRWNRHAETEEACIYIDPSYEKQIHSFIYQTYREKVHRRSGEVIESRYF